MNVERLELEARFNSLSDEEVIRLISSGNLTELAQSIAATELEQRGVSLPSIEPTIDEPEEALDHDVQMRIVAHHLTPTEAYILCARLQAEGIPAEAGNANFAQTYSLYTFAVGGACLRVPLEYIPQAMQVIDAFNRGEFRLDEDFNFDKAD
ncbi:MAG TPA: hypothetical protein VIE69_05320 [Methylophilaceae bacterium]|jgi:hypothetical protein